MSERRLRHFFLLLLSCSTGMGGSFRALSSLDALSQRERAFYTEHLKTKDAQETFLNSDKSERQKVVATQRALKEIERRYKMREMAILGAGLDSKREKQRLSQAQSEEFKRQKREDLIEQYVLEDRWNDPNESKAKVAPIYAIDWVNRKFNNYVLENDTMKALLKLGLLASAFGLFARSVGLDEYAKQKVKQMFDRPTIYEFQNLSKKSFFGAKRKKMLLDDLVLSPKVRRPIRELITLVQRNKELAKLPAQPGTKKKKFYYPHILLYGPPGTGKTTLAETIAHETGMNLISLAASKFNKLKSVSDQIAVIDEIFNKANKAGNTIIFLDEIESMVKDRESEGADENHFLISLMTQTSKPTDRFMVIGATNYKKKVDSAILSRLGTQIEVSLPTVLGIRQILDKKINEHLISYGYQSEVDTLKWAKKLIGTPGRNLEKLVFAFGRRLDANEQNRLTDDIVAEVLFEKGMISLEEAGDAGRHYMEEYGEELSAENILGKEGLVGSEA